MDTSTQNRDDKLRFIYLLTAVVTVLLFIAIAVLIIGSAKPSLKTKDNSAIEYTLISVSSNQIHEGDLVLVNATYEYTFPSAETDTLQQLSTLHPENYGLAYPARTQLRGDALTKANEMLNQVGKIVTDTQLLVNSAYCSKEDQAKKENSPFAAGHSDSHTGLGFSVSFLDYSAYSKHSEVSSWFTAHAAEYGFIIRYPNAKSDVTGVSDYTNYFRYVGIPHAVAITQYNLDGTNTAVCFDEYVKLLSKYEFSKEHLKIDVDGDNKEDYEIYYVKATADTTQIQVPKDTVNHPYTISGNNIDGFIITVKL